MTLTHPLQLKHSEPLAKYSTFGVGGPAKYLIVAKLQDELIEAINYFKTNQIPYFILGKGSNSVFCSEGVNGGVIVNQCKSLVINDDCIEVSSGYSFAHLGVQLSRKSLGGLEFASGIPGTVGGAIFMNAGACGSDVSEVLLDVTFLDEHGVCHTYVADQLGFSYRTSIFQKKNWDIISARFKVYPSNNAKSIQSQLLKKRLATQPYSEKSAGCAFRNPDGEFSAGALIEKLGLKGRQIGGVKVSEKHANFLINTGNGTYEDLERLKGEIKAKIFAEYGIVFEEELRCIPYELSC